VPIPLIEPMLATNRQLDADATVRISHAAFVANHVLWSTRLHRGATMSPLDSPAKSSPQSRHGTTPETRR